MPLRAYHLFKYKVANVIRYGSWKNYNTRFLTLFGMGVGKNYNTGFLTSFGMTGCWRGRKEIQDFSLRSKWGY